MILYKKFKNIVNASRRNLSSYLRKVKLNYSLPKEHTQHLARTVNCHHKWYGSSYGGFYIIPGLLDKDAIIYSFGIGTDISFDRACMLKHSSHVYAFDPTPKSIQWVKSQKLPGLFHFFEYGISSGMTGMVNFYLPGNPKGVSGSLFHTADTDEQNKIPVLVKSFSDIVKELGHHHIDVLKMDIEGAEYEVLEDILNTSIPIDQILVEFHDRYFDQNEIRSKEIVRQLKDKGYEIFGTSLSYEEISFVHRHKLK